MSEEATETVTGVVGWAPSETVNEPAVPPSVIEALSTEVTRSAVWAPAGTAMPMNASARTNTATFALRTSCHPLRTFCCPLRALCCPLIRF